MIDQYDYYCSKCNSKLNINKRVEFNIKNQNNENARIYLDPKPRKYSFRCEPTIDFSHREEIDFYCIHCDTNLVSNEFPFFIKILLKLTDKVFFDVYFSRIYGVHETYVGIEDFTEEYGDKMMKIQN